VVPPGDAAAFRDALLGFASNPASIDSMGASAERGAAAQWSAESDLDSWAALVREL
jgi:hypothetical protein